ncbi:DUF4902 domain-containing protein [Caballeronia sp. SEWSISQ10-4 2]|uniref:DUF4902 domain-containing protein n=1 Tax=Caballeronia sp. SEWSISQ10-4 2 TaxID=2937438 RepID=UPI0034624F9F
MKAPHNDSIKLCSDGYIRLTARAVKSTRLVHTYSCVDDELLLELRSSTANVHDAGYTEWQSVRCEGSPRLSIGWSWYRDSVSRTLLIEGQDVRSNVMLIDSYGIDVGGVRTAAVLLGYLAELNWTSVVYHEILRLKRAASIAPRIAKFSRI